MKTNQTVEQLIESLLAEYQDVQESIKRADQAYAEYLKNRKSVSLSQIKKDNDLAN